jgi:hypothetical protein
MESISIPFSYNSATKLLYILVGIFGILMIYISFPVHNLDSLLILVVGYFLFKLSLSTFFKKVVFNYKSKQILLVEGLFIRKLVNISELESWGIKTYSLPSRGSSLSLNIIFKMKNGSFQTTTINPDAREAILGNIEKITSQNPKSIAKIKTEVLQTLMSILLP